LTDFSEDINILAKTIIKKCKILNYRISVAESCTGGLIAACLTDIPGASKIFDRGYVTYSDNSKVKELKVSNYIIDNYGAVSQNTAISMSEGALKESEADISLSVTGIAGPDGGTKEKPVGLVFISISNKQSKTIVKKYLVKGNRKEIRYRTIINALKLLEKKIDNIRKNQN